ncbi:MAG: hypothetical protein R2795_03695 [Saprospiraceae bacterium]
MKKHSDRRDNGIKEELEVLGANRLSDWHQQAKRTPSAPDGWWDELAQKAAQSSGKTVHRTTYVRRLAMAVSGVAAALVLLLLAYQWLPRQATQEVVAASQTASDEAIKQYILDNIEEFDVDLLAQIEGVQEDAFLPIDTTFDDATIEQFFENEDWEESILF